MITLCFSRTNKTFGCVRTVFQFYIELWMDRASQNFSLVEKIYIYKQILGNVQNSCFTSTIILKLDLFLKGLYLYTFDPPILELKFQYEPFFPRAIHIVVNISTSLFVNRLIFSTLIMYILSVLNK